jgi:hypothetical protein
LSKTDRGAGRGDRSSGPRAWTTPLLDPGGTEAPSAIMIMHAIAHLRLRLLAIVIAPPRSSAHLPRTFIVDNGDYCRNFRVPWVQARVQRARTYHPT